MEIEGRKSSTERTAGSQTIWYRKQHFGAKENAIDSGGENFDSFDLDQANLDHSPILDDGGGRNGLHVADFHKFENVPEAKRGAFHENREYKERVCMGQPIDLASTHSQHCQERDHSISEGDSEYHEYYDQHKCNRFTNNVSSRSGQNSTINSQGAPISPLHQAPDNGWMNEDQTWGKLAPIHSSPSIAGLSPISTNRKRRDLSNDLQDDASEDLLDGDLGLCQLEINIRGLDVTTGLPVPRTIPNHTSEHQTGAGAKQGVELMEDYAAVLRDRIWAASAHAGSARNALKSEHRIQHGYLLFIIIFISIFLHFGLYCQLPSIYIEISADIRTTPFMFKRRPKENRKVKNQHPCNSSDATKSTVSQGIASLLPDQTVISDKKTGNGRLAMRRPASGDLVTKSTTRNLRRGLDISKKTKMNERAASAAGTRVDRRRLKTGKEHLDRPPKTTAPICKLPAKRNEDIGLREKVPAKERITAKKIGATGHEEVRDCCVSGDFESEGGMVGAIGRSRQSSRQPSQAGVLASKFERGSGITDLIGRKGPFTDNLSSEMTSPEDYGIRGKNQTARHTHYYHSPLW